MKKMEGRKKTGGRKAGTPNVITNEVRKALKAVLMDEVAQLPDMLKELPNDKRIDVITKLMPYILPKVNPVPMERGEPITWDP